MKKNIVFGKKIKKIKMKNWKKSRLRHATIVGTLNIFWAMDVLVGTMNPINITLKSIEESRLAQWVAAQFDAKFLTSGRSKPV